MEAASGLRLADVFVSIDDPRQAGKVKHDLVELLVVMDVMFNDDQMRARTRHAAHNLAILKHITLNLIRRDPVKRKGGIRARRLIAATSDNYRAELFGLN